MGAIAEEQVVALVQHAAALLSESGPDQAESVDRAIGALEQALGLLSVGHRAARGTVLVNLGVAFRARLHGDAVANRDRAVDLFAEALKLRDREREPVEWARVQNALGVALYERLSGDPLANGRDAIGALSAALKVRRALGDPDDVAITLTNLANVLARQAGADRNHNIQQAVEHYREALALLDPDNVDTRAAVRLNLASALLDLPLGDRADNVEEAIAALEAALSDLDGHEHDAAELALANALGLRLRGSKADNLERAIALAEAVLDRRRRAASAYRQASAMNSLGILYGRRIRGGRADNLDRAVSLYREALAIYTPDRYPGDRAGTLNNLATALRALPLGDRHANEEEAAAALREALAVYTRDRDPFSWAGTMSNLGTTLFERRTGNLSAHIDGAIVAYEQALEVRTRQEHPWEWGATEFNLGQALWRRHHRDRLADLQRAVTALEKSLLVRTRELSPDEWAASQSMLAVVLDELSGLTGADDRAEAAEQAYRQALEIYEPGSFPFEARANANNLAGLLLRRGRPAPALEVALQGLRAAEALYLAAPTEEGREIELDDNARLYRIAAEAAIEAGKSDAEIFALAEAARARLLGDWLAVGELPVPAALNDDEVACERRLAGELRAALRRARELESSPDRQGAVVEARRLREGLDAVWTQIGRSLEGAAYVARRRGEPIGAAQLESWLDAQPGRTGIVVLSPLSDGPVAFAAASGQPIERVPLSVTHNEVAAYITDLEQEVIDSRGPLSSAESWRQIGEQVLAPALNRLPDDLDLLYVVPFGRLHGVPWHASTVNGHALIDHVATAYLPGAGAAVHLTGAPAPRPGPDTLVIGDPLGDLSHARAEAGAVAGQLHAVPLVGARADRGTVSSRFTGTAWAHFATHGVYDAADPMNSGVELADGRLTAREMLRLGGAKHVVLSSCESGRQSVTAGDELWGLARALLYTGARTAVLSLWRVDDEATSLLMRRFYSLLHRESDPARPHVAQALREAMLATREVHSHSYFWAPFTVLGSPW
ncbi:MAG TPA: CHAT domain-containing protein [Solirubrobacteraceae bacterium]|nr:CHAT domain-containing protein [Solirubrobacteraceae bacterium]